MRAQGENLSQRTADTLRKMILEKETYTYGEKLPNENELSEKLGISRTTLREARWYPRGFWWYRGEREPLWQSRLTVWQTAGSV